MRPESPMPTRLWMALTLAALLSVSFGPVPASVRAQDPCAQSAALPAWQASTEDAPERAVLGEDGSDEGTPDESAPDESAPEERAPGKEPVDGAEGNAAEGDATEDDAGPGSLAALTKAWWSAEKSDERGAAALQLLVAGESAATVADALRASRTFAADLPRGKVHIWKRPGRKTEHTCFLAIPSSYDPTQPMPLLVWLHGGVARPADGGGASGIRLWAEKAEEEGFLLLCPSAQTGSEWWTPTGVELVRGALADVRRRYNVDAARIAAGGFSDGASGCFHLLAHAPDPFCCFLALMGQPLVTRLMGGPTAAANLSARPVWAVHGGQDQLYPTSRLEPIMKEMQLAGMDLTWQDLPDTGHSFQALPSLWDEMHAFWASHPLEALPRRVDWQSAAPKVDGRCSWVEILEVGPSAPVADQASSEKTDEASSDKADGKAADRSSDEAGEPLPLSILALPAPNPRPRLGIRLDTSYPGPGLKIEEVEEGTPAEAADFRADDIIVSVDGEAIANPGEITKLRDALDRMKEAQEDGVFVLKRGDDEVEAKARPKVLPKDLEGPEPKGPGQKGPHGRVQVQVEAGNNIKIRSRGVKRVRLHLSPELIDFAQPITVYVNGTQRYEGVVAGNIAHLLSEAWRDAGIPRYHAALVLSID